MSWFLVAPSKARRTSTSAPSVQRTILNLPAGGRFLATNYSALGVLSFLPRMTFDTLAFSGPMVLLIALRVQLSYPICDRLPENQSFVNERTDGCSSIEMGFRIVESGLIAHVRAWCASWLQFAVPLFFTIPLYWLGMSESALSGQRTHPARSASSVEHDHPGRRGLGALSHVGYRLRLSLRSVHLLGYPNIAAVVLSCDLRLHSHGANHQDASLRLCAGRLSLPRSGISLCIRAVPRALVHSG